MNHYIPHIILVTLKGKNAFCSQWKHNKAGKKIFLINKDQWYDEKYYECYAQVIL